MQLHTIHEASHCLLVMENCKYLGISSEIFDIENVMNKQETELPGFVAI